MCYLCRAFFCVLVTFALSMRSNCYFCSSGRSSGGNEFSNKGNIWLMSVTIRRRHAVCGKTVGSKSTKLTLVALMTLIRAEYTLVWHKYVRRKLNMFYAVKLRLYGKL